MSNKANKGIIIVLASTHPLSLSLSLSVKSHIFAIILPSLPPPFTCIGRRTRRPPTLLAVGLEGVALVEEGQASKIPALHPTHPPKGGREVDRSLKESRRRRRG